MLPPSSRRCRASCNRRDGMARASLGRTGRRSRAHMRQGRKAMLAAAVLGLGLAAGCADRKTTIRRETETTRTPPRVVEEQTVVTPPADQEETTVIERRRRVVEED